MGADAAHRDGCAHTRDTFHGRVPPRCLPIGRRPSKRSLLNRISGLALSVPIDHATVSSALGGVSRTKPGLNACGVICRVMLRTKQSALPGMGGLR